jgi:membrane fusion protein (multidrug efflux system)
VHAATLQVVSYYDEYPGIVVPLMQVDIRPQAEGYITGMFFTEGGKVKKGQKLYEIDRSKYNATYNQSEANVQVAEANLAQAQKDADRYTYLSEHDAIAKQTLDHALTTLQNAKNQLAAAKQDKLRAATDLNYAIVKAPFDGVIGISQVRVGNTVSPGQTVLNTISSEGAVAVDFLINEKQLGFFLMLQQLHNTASDSTFSLILPDNTTFGHFGVIHIVDRGVNPQTGTVTVRLKFADPQSTLRPGLSCKVRVHKQDNEPHLLIPHKAIVEQMGEYFVYIAKDTTLPAQSADTVKGKTLTGMYAIQRKVTLGVSVADQIMVLGGIEEGDQVIAEGVQKLRNGAKIALSK